MNEVDHLLEHRFETTFPRRPLLQPVSLSLYPRPSPVGLTFLFYLFVPNRVHYNKVFYVILELRLPPSLIELT